MSAESQRISREHPSLAAALAGQYALERELGHGGMGIVFLARDLKLDRAVAIKTLLPHLAADIKLRERFLREARAAAKLAHPNIVPIHRADEIDGQVFFVMGYVDGESLADMVRVRPLEPALVIRLLGDVARALHAAHMRGVVHRDVKAENILVERDSGRPLITDFGIARLIESAPLTATGLVLGTVLYMSPEQVAGEAVDGRSDLYSLGVLGFFALSGRFPFENPMPSAVLVAHVTRVPPPLRSVAPAVPPALAAILDRCLAKDPGARFASCAELAMALDALVLPDATRPARRVPPLSESEAQRVWERAAQLQADPAAPLAAPGTRALPPSPSSAYDAGIVRDAAREAGIGTEFIDRALAEREGASRAVAARDGAPAARAAPGEIQNLSGPVNAWSGTPMLLAHELSIEGEMPEREYDRLVETMRRSLGDVGVVSIIGRSFAWRSSDRKRKVEVIVQSRHGMTQIRVSEDLRPFAGELFGGYVGGVGGGVGGSMMGLLAGAAHMPLAGIASALAFAAGMYGFARVKFGRSVRRRAKRMRDIADALAAEVSEAIGEPPPPPAH